jgi:hypothetical protein
MSNKRNNAHFRKLRSIAKRRKKEEQSIPAHVRYRRVAEQRAAAENARLREEQNVAERRAGTSADSSNTAETRERLSRAYDASLSSEARAARDARLRGLKEQIEASERNLRNLFVVDEAFMINPAFKAVLDETVSASVYAHRS